MIAATRLSDVLTRRHPDTPTEPRHFTTWRRHRCEAQHRTTRTWMRCALGRRVEWISGRGRFAVVAYCRVTTVTLWETPDAARHACRVIDATGCGGRCRNRHQLVHVDLEAVAP